MIRVVLTTGSLILFALTVSAQPNANAGFIEYVTERVNREVGKNTGVSGKSPITRLCPIDESLFARRAFAEYGAIFAATEKVTAPPVCIFADEAMVSAFRSSIQIRQMTIGGVNLLLQKEAADALTKVLTEADQLGISIIPLDGSIAGGRTYYETSRIWNSRFDPGLEYWTRRGVILGQDALAVRSLKLDKQVGKVIEWESKGYWFGTNRNGSIFSSTAPPGTSQHISLLALDIAPPLMPSKRALMNSSGWFQTVRGDPGHFTYMGLPESELPKRGLKAVLSDGIIYWIPNLPRAQRP